jgi:Carboxypeptidase regulatory-like domain
VEEVVAVIGRRKSMAAAGRGARAMMGAALVAALLFAGPLCAHAQQQSDPAATPATTPVPTPTMGQALPEQATQQLLGSVSGTVVDPSGAAVVGAKVTLSRAGQSVNQEAVSDSDGQFSIANVAAGVFQLTITAEGFATQTFSGAARPGEICVVPPIGMALAAENTAVQVTVPRVEVAEAEIKEQEKQRVLGVIPNFYVSYVHDAAPLTSSQKFELAWRTTVDPVTFVLTGAFAGLQQAQDDFGGYGQGAQGYGKRFGATYADLVTSTFIGSALLPSLLKQDPRYFYKGTGTARARALYAIVNAVICKGDNKHWQPNYSGIAGSIAAGGISNLYYPTKDRGADLTFENALIGIGQTAAANLLQEFVIRKLTPKASNPDPATP